MSQETNIKEELYPEKCPKCGGIHFIPTNRIKEKRQVIHLPEIKPKLLNTKK